MGPVREEEGPLWVPLSSLPVPVREEGVPVGQSGFVREPGNGYPNCSWNGALKWSPEMGCPGAAPRAK
eukprot:11584602-Alexandrium_andersonii.AAC.1